MTRIEQDGADLPKLREFVADIYGAFGLAESDNHDALLQHIADVRSEARESANVMAELAKLREENGQLLKAVAYLYDKAQRLPITPSRDYYDEQRMEEIADLKKRLEGK